MNTDNDNREPIEFAGDVVIVKRVSGWDALRLSGLAYRLKGSGAVPDDIAKTKLSPMGILAMFSRALESVVRDIDFSSDVLPANARLLFGEVGKFIGKTAEEVAAAPLDDAYRVVATIMDQEAQSSLGKQIRAMSEPLTRISRAMVSLADNLTAAQSRASSGGMSDGGETGSYTPSPNPTDGPSTTSSGLASVTSSGS